MKAPAQKPPITERITAFLATTAEATAGQIARAIGEADYPSRVTSALNTLRTDALIECERKGKGNELWYWLVSAAPASTEQPEDLPPGIRPGTRYAQVWHELRDGLELTANALAQRMTCSAGAVAPVLSELIKNGTLERRKGLDGYRYFRPQPTFPPATEGEAGNGRQTADAATAAGTADDGTAQSAQTGDADDADDLQYIDDGEEMPPADPVLLASANRMLHERMERIAHVLRGCGLPALANVQAGEDLQVAAAALAGAYITTAADLRAAQAALKAEQAELDTERLAREALQEQLDAAQDVKDAATGYLVRAPKRRPRVLTNPENARAAALATARTAGRADVLALVPVGRAVRGAEWKAAQP